MRRCVCFLLALLYAFSLSWSSPLPGYVQLSTTDYQRLVEICEKLKTLNEVLLSSSQISTSEIEILKKEIQTTSLELTELKSSLSQLTIERQALNEKLLEAEVLLLKALDSLKNSEKSLIAQSLLMQATVLKWKVATAVVATVALAELIYLLSSAAKSLITAD